MVKQAFPSLVLSLILVPVTSIRAVRCLRVSEKDLFSHNLSLGCRNSRIYGFVIGIGGSSSPTRRDYFSGIYTTLDHHVLLSCTDQQQIHPVLEESLGVMQITVVSNTSIQGY